MPDTLRVDAAGAVIGIDLDGLDAETTDLVRRAWQGALSPRDDEPAQIVTPNAGSAEVMLEALSQQVTLAAIDAKRGRAWMLHAAGVAGPRGDVVVLVGPSGRGKTTASRALARELGYVSDETVAIDASGLVYPYRKPLSVIVDPGRPKQQVSPAEAGLADLPAAPLRVRAIVLLDRSPEHEGAPEVEIADLGDALGELVSQSSFLTHADAPLRFIAGVAEATGGVRRVRYREAVELAPVVARLMDASAPPVSIPPVSTPALEATAPSLPQAVAETPTEGGSPAPAAASARYWRTAWLDYVDLHDPDGIAVLTADSGGDGTVRVLAGIAPELWRAADGRDLAGLVAAATARYGSPEGVDGTAAVLQAIGALMDAGLVASDEG